MFFFFCSLCNQEFALKVITNMAKFLQQTNVQNESPEKIQKVASGIIKAAGSLLKVTSYQTNSLENKKKLKVMRADIIKIVKE